jgi:hypothetical protein
MGLTPAQVISAQNGSYLPSLPEISSFGLSAKLSKKQVSDLVDKAMDDLAAAGTTTKQAPAKKPERTSPKKPVNNW